MSESADFDTYSLYIFIWQYGIIESYHNFDYLKEDVWDFKAVLVDRVWMETDEENIVKENQKYGSRDELGKILKKAVSEGSKSKAILFLDELRTTLEAKGMHTETGIGLLNYFFALGALSFTCKYISYEEIKKMLAAVDIQTEPRLNQRMQYLRYDNYGAYMNAIYFLVSLGMRPDIENIFLVMESMQMKPEVSLAERAIRYFDEFSQGKITYEIHEPERETSVIFNKVAQMIFSISSETSDFVSLQIDAMLKSKEAEAYLNRDLFLYLAIVGLLTYSGKESTAEAILNVAHSVNREMDEVMIRNLQDMHASPHVFYLAAIYFIKAIGKEASLDRISRVVQIMGISPDYNTAGAAVAFFKSRNAI